LDPLIDRSVRAVTLDLHSTLVFVDVDDVEGRYRVAYDCLAGELALPSFPEFFDVALSSREELLLRCDRDMIEINVAERLKTALGLMGHLSVDPCLLAWATAQYIDRWIDGLRAPNGLARDLALLHAKYKLGLITNFGDVSGVHRIIGRFGLNDLFDAVVISAELGIRKPHPRLFHVAVSRLRCPAAEIAHVGDDLDADVKGSRAIGALPILMDALEKYPNYSDLRVMSTAELLSVLM
jgi:putative hydrolase of the HAD superfamily